MEETPAATFKSLASEREFIVRAQTSSGINLSIEDPDGRAFGIAIDPGEAMEICEAILWVAGYGGEHKKQDSPEGHASTAIAALTLGIRAQNKNATPSI